MCKGWDLEGSVRVAGKIVWLDLGEWDLKGIVLGNVGMRCRDFIAWSLLDSYVFGGE